jgi:CHAD domain-containing protein
MVAVAPLQPSLQSLRAGSHAHGLIQQLARRLHRLAEEVLTDSDPEDLHQLRVTLRRLRSVLRQFSPALILPPRVRGSRLAELARSTGRTRDLDVVLERLEQTMCPLLPSWERDRLQPLLAQVRKQRRHWFRRMREDLRSSRVRNLQRALSGWCTNPAYTVLGRQPLQPWMPDWHLALVNRLFLLPGWFATDPHDESLHQLRKALKEIRYGVDHLQPLLPPATYRWVDTLKQAQAMLGDLQDFHVMAKMLRKGHHDGAGPSELSTLSGLLAAEQSATWRRWQGLAGHLLQPSHRHALQTLQPEPND